jgi:hypothetical protein
MVPLHLPGHVPAERLGVDVSVGLRLVDSSDPVYQPSSDDTSFDKPSISSSQQPTADQA